jgi:hypothetical protein
MILALVVLNCLADIRAHERELTHYLPGNDSRIRFSKCEAESLENGAVIDGSGNWRISQVNQFGTVWSYSGKVYAHIDVDERCDVTEVKVWTKPENWMLEPLITQAEKVIWKRFDKIIKAQPEYRKICWKGTP